MGFNDFDLQEYLADMRRELREDHLTVVRKVDLLMDQSAEHDKRLTILENLHHMVKWSVGTVVGAAIAALFAWIVALVHRP